SHPRELPGPHDLVRVGEGGPDADGAGLGVDRAVDERHAPLVGEHRTVRQQQRQRGPRALGGAALRVELDPGRELQIVGLRDGEVDVDGVDRGDGGEQGRIALAYEVATVHLYLAHDAGHRGFHGGVVDVEL